MLTNDESGNKAESKHLPIYPSAHHFVIRVIAVGAVFRDTFGMNQHEELRRRTKQFSLRIIKMYQALPKTTEAQVIGKQVIRSSTSVGANYRACGRSKSKADFVNKITIVLEEIDETVFWLELLVESGILRPGQLRDLVKESNELLAIFAASKNTAKFH